jgi:rhodanese-related sulfurtransferase
MDGSITPIAAADLKARMDAGEDLVLLDVRESGELAICAIPGATHIPLGELSDNHFADVRRARCAIPLQRCVNSALHLPAFRLP